MASAPLRRLPAPAPTLSPHVRTPQRLSPLLRSPSGRLPAALPPTAIKLPPGSIDVLVSAAGAGLGAYFGSQLLELWGRAAAINWTLSHHRLAGRRQVPPYVTEIATLVAGLLGGTLAHYLSPWQGR